MMPPRPDQSGRRCAVLPGRRGLVALLAALVLTSIGCNSVHRRMTIRSEPVGARVFVDGQDVGFTPCSVDFTYYGTREIMLVKDGYETLTVLQKVPAPWYQYPVIEFVTDNFWPRRITDRHEFLYRMQPQVMPPTQELIDRANSLRSETQVGP